jgi:triosephosphate isomerase
MKPFVIANWKCNPKTLIEAKKLFNSEKKTNAIICPPFQYISIFKYKNLGAQNCFWKDSGPYTGEVSPKMLKSLSCGYVIIGHSERREHFKETDGMINKKLKAALKAGLKPILCIGEKRGENAEKIISSQLKKDLEGIENCKLKIENLIIAYEPVWAIGTGNFCKPQKAKQALDFIKQRINNKVLYGGSVNSKIARDYIKVGFDGLLVGGASLDAREFTKIVKNV